MSMPNELSALPGWLSEAFAARGFAQPTAIQKAVLDPALRGRDLRISSATGSGKTIALSAVLGEALFDDHQDVEDRCEDGEDVPRQVGRKPVSESDRPRVLVVAPTRELATQLARELRDLYGRHGHRVALVLGGGSYRQEVSALRARPSVLVATPGRLVDHMQRGQVDLGGIAAVALDEADQLMALGFREELEQILGACPSERRTIMSSATFSGQVLQLAKRHQRDAVRVEGTPVGAPHADIEHVGHVVRPHDQLAAMTNLLLSAGDERCLIFVAMRAQAAELAQALSERGFATTALSGEMSQAERVRALDAFRRGRVRTLVATDVAARGIDVDGVRWVIHASPPRDIEALIHRSGRTGRAGQRGCSIQLLTPVAVRKVQRMFSQAGLSLRLQPVPGPEAIARSQAERWADRLAASDANDANDASEDGEASDPRSQALLLEVLLGRFEPDELLRRLVNELHGQAACAPEVIEPVMLRDPRADARPRPEARGPRGPRGEYALFEVNYGSRAGATPQRVMAMICRRGQVQRKHIGSIDVADGVTHVEVAAPVAEAFARAVTRPDARDRHVHIRPVASGRPRRKPPTGPGGHGRRPPPRKPHRGSVRGSAGDRADAPNGV